MAKNFGFTPSEVDNMQSDTVQYILYTLKEYNIEQSRQMNKRR